MVLMGVFVVPVPDFTDWVVSPMPNPDDPRLNELFKKGFSERVRAMSDEELDDWASLYPVWYLRRLRKLPVLWSEKEKKVKVCLPNTRAHRSGQYWWFKHLPLPNEGYWYFLTLTFYREVGFRRAWEKVNRWVSAFFQRFRSYLYARFNREIEYIWVVEQHKDGFPHVHIVFMMPFIQELNFHRLLSLFQSWWVDEDGNPLCAPHGIEFEYIGRDVRHVQEYVLKYLVDDHQHRWGFVLLPDGKVAYRRSTAYIWLYKVRLFGMSYGIRERARKLLGEIRSTRGVSDYKFFWDDFG